MPKLVAWVKEQTFDGRPPTREELTAQAYQILINNGEEVILSKSWVDSLLRSQDSPFKQVKSKPLKEEPFYVTTDEIIKWINLLT